MGLKQLWSPVLGDGQKECKSIYSPGHSAVAYTIHCTILLDNLSGLGVGSTVLWQFLSYLESSSQRVVLGDCCLVLWPLIFGIPKESIFSPMLFDIFLKLG